MIPIPGNTQQSLLPPILPRLSLVHRRVLVSQGPHKQTPPGLGSRRGDGSVSLQASCVPDLCLDSSGAQHYSAGGELNPDGGAAIVAELIAGEPGQQIGLAHA